jgi:hypothetical protein
MAVAAIALAVPASFAADPSLPEGNWRVSQHFNAIAEQRLCVIKIEKKDGKLAATLLDSMKQVMKKGEDPSPIPVKIKEFKADGDNVHLAIEFGRQLMVFDGTVAKDKKKVLGAIGDDKRAMRGMLTTQNGEKLEIATAADRPKAPEPYLEATKLNNAPFTFQFKAQQSKDANEKAELQAKAKEARAEADAKVPGLYKETIEKHGDSPYATVAAASLLASAGKSKATPQDVAAWVKVIDADVVKFGDRMVRETALSTAESLIAQKGFDAIAMAAVDKAMDGMTEKTPLMLQSRSLKAMKTLLTNAGKVNEAKALDTKIAKVETALDEDYIKTVPPFKPEHFAGRKDKEANKVAVMELFTGAQCPPCVAADAAFDALEHAYMTKDLILIQYHMHIPGPDPLTNKDTIARWDYYGKLFPKQMGGVPSSIFGGKPQSGGGGGMAFAEDKFKDYTAIVNKLVEEKTDVKVMGSAKRTGDKISINVDVDGVKDPGEKIKLRVLLVEEKIKYVGGNGMRFHHQVVRALPGGAEGTAIKEKSFKKTVDFDVAELKKILTKYLEEFNSERPFPNPDRPMDMAHLKVIALVQDDATGEILNATEFDVQGK